MTDHVNTKMDSIYDLLEREVLSADLPDEEKTRFLKMVYRLSTTRTNLMVVGPTGAGKVRGRGGTRLQPGIDLLNADETFPKDAPLLTITGGDCGRLHPGGREHACLIPAGKRLPFVPKGPVFRLQ